MCPRNVGGLAVPTSLGRRTKLKQTALGLKIEKRHTDVSHREWRVPIGPAMAAPNVGEPAGGLG